MNLTDFRIYHSTLIEHYQFIESHLEGIYAAISEKDILQGFQDVQNDNFHRIIKKIKEIENQKNISLFTDKEHKQMEKIFQRRNFWCHNCYYDMVFDIKTGGPKKAQDVQLLLSDIREAEEFREKIFAMKSELFDKNKNTLLSSQQL